jgi:hypothetical protein
MWELECDPDYVQALGRAIYNFSVLEHAVIRVVRTLSQGYGLNLPTPGKRGARRARPKTAGQIACDFIKELKGAPPNLVPLMQPIASEFRQLVNERNALLHAYPFELPDGSMGLLKADHREFALWPKEQILKLAAEFHRAAETALDLIARHGW